MRRINTIEYIISVFITIILAFTTNAMVKNNYDGVECIFGLPFNWISVYQDKLLSNNLYTNLSKGNLGININILSFIFDTIFFYFIIIWIKQLLKKFKNKNRINI